MEFSPLLGIPVDPRRVGNAACRGCSRADVLPGACLRLEVNRSKPREFPASLEHQRPNCYLINPTRIVPLGPDLDFLSPHGRERLSAPRAQRDRSPSPA